MTWHVEFHPACEAWADRLAQPDAEALLAAIRILRDEGPNLGRPLVDKSSNWRAWYEKNVPIADSRFAEHQAKIRTGGKEERR